MKGHPLILTWKQTEKNVDRTVYTSQPDGDYEIVGVPDPRGPRGVAALKVWTLEHKGVELSHPGRLSEAKRAAQTHHETMISGAPRRRHAATAASLTARIADAIRDRFADRATGHVGDHAGEIAALAVGVMAEPFPDVEPSRCTHGADCAVHPDVQQLHNFDPTAADMMEAVLAAVQIRHKFDADDVREIAARHGVSLRR